MKKNVMRCALAALVCLVSAAVCGCGIIADVIEGFTSGAGGYSTGLGAANTPAATATPAAEASATPAAGGEVTEQERETLSLLAACTDTVISRNGTGFASTGELTLDYMLASAYTYIMLAQPDFPTADGYITVSDGEMDSIVFDMFGAHMPNGVIPELYLHEDGAYRLLNDMEGCAEYDILDVREDEDGAYTLTFAKAWDGECVYLMGMRVARAEGRFGFNVLSLENGGLPEEDAEQYAGLVLADFTVEDGGEALADIDIDGVPDAVYYRDAELTPGYIKFEFSGLGAFCFDIAPDDCYRNPGRTLYKKLRVLVKEYAKGEYAYVCMNDMPGNGGPEDGLGYYVFCVKNGALERQTPATATELYGWSAHDGRSFSLEDTASGYSETVTLPEGKTVAADSAVLGDGYCAVRAVAGEKGTDIAIGEYVFCGGRADGVGIAFTQYRIDGGGTMSFIAQWFEPGV